MPKSDERFYLLKMRNRDVLWGDVGSLIRISGLVVSGGGAWSILMLPEYRDEFMQYVTAHPPVIPEMDLEAWTEFINHSDNPEILIGPAVGNATLPKIFQRKVRWEISGSTQQKVWKADGFKCYYCGAKMGDALLTIDHFQPLELGGKNDTTNFLACCKRENKEKGSIDAREWCKLKNLDYEKIKSYLASRILT